MTDQELFLFDLRGYVVIENVLTPQEVSAGNAAVDQHLDLVRKREPGLAQGGEHLVAATGRGELRQNPLSFERPWCEPFRRMLIHPKIIDVFNEVLGAGFRLDHGPSLIQMDSVTEGHRLHGGMTFDPSQYHGFDHGKMHCGLCVAAWQLTDVTPGDGGFRLHSRQPQGQLPAAHGGAEAGCRLGLRRAGGSAGGGRGDLQRGAGSRDPSVEASRARAPVDPLQILARFHLLGQPA